ncbi:MAG: putative oxygenase [Bryobacterales bacterium]|jgi:L-asparagine oxygenase|nr:putative oxygenase [Bryobacterales bacterium]
MASVPSLPLHQIRPLAEPPSLRLPDRNREDWSRDACALVFPDYRDVEAWTAFRDASVSLAQRRLPADLSEALHDFFAPAGPSALIVENLPVDPELPPIPADGMRPRNKQAVSEAVICGLIGMRGEILAYLNEKHGAPIQEVVPISGMERIQSNAGRVRFGFHSDNAFLPRRFRQKGILLFGLRNHDAATLVLTADQIMGAAPSDLAASLAKPIFRHACPASFSFSGAPAVSAPCPILWRDELGLVRVSAASSSIEPLTPEAAEALTSFRTLLMALEPARIVVRPGTALLFKDDRVLHGRDSFAGSRWLQRAYFTDSLDPLRKATRSGPLTFAFDAGALLSA